MALALGARDREFDSHHFDILRRKGDDLMLVSEAAKKLGMSTQTLRLALRQNLFPFGVAVLTSEKRFTYYVNAVALDKYIKGELSETKDWNNSLSGGNCDIVHDTNCTNQHSGTRY